MLTLAADVSHWDLSRLTSPGQLWPNVIALLTLTGLEIVLGIDNVVFIAILSGKLPPHQQAKARQTGLGLALITRIIFLCTITLIMGAAKTDLFTVPLLDHGVTGKDLVLIIGGLFLIWKSTKEVHHQVEGNPQAEMTARKAASFWGVIFQILLIDMVFSIDSVVTAVGMAQELLIMIAAVIISVAIMLLAAGKISTFINRHPSLKMLALSFLLLIGVVLVADGLGQHMSKGYIYFAMAFSLAVEMLNISVRKKSAPKPPPQ